MKRNLEFLVIGVIAGAVAGFVGGLLLAPSSGYKTRQRLANEALKAADLVDTLKGDGPFTVFAPTDEAFAKVPAGTIDELLKPENKEKLARILTYHVVPGRVMAADVVKLSNAKTVEGSEVNIKVNDGHVKVNDANVVKTDIAASNGVIHVIDAVILTK